MVDTRVASLEQDTVPVNAGTKTLMNIQRANWKYQIGMLQLDTRAEIGRSIGFLKGM
jgi:hypothetical protein